MAIQYERKSGAYSRVHSFAKQLLMVGDCQTVSNGSSRIRLKHELTAKQGILPAQYDGRSGARSRARRHTRNETRNPFETC